MDWPSSWDPCMPTPIMPKRTRSLAATGRGEANTGVGFSSMVFVARDAPAAAAPISRNLRRENLLILWLLASCDFSNNTSVYVTRRLVVYYASRSERTRLNRVQSHAEARYGKPESVRANNADPDPFSIGIF